MIDVRTASTGQDTNWIWHASSLKYHTTDKYDHLTQTHNTSSRPTSPVLSFNCWLTTG